MFCFVFPFVFSDGGVQILDGQRGLLSGALYEVGLGPADQEVRHLPRRLPGQSCQAATVPQAAPRAASKAFLKDYKPYRWSVDPLVVIALLFNLRSGKWVFRELMLIQGEG